MSKVIKTVVILAVLTLIGIAGYIAIGWQSINEIGRITAGFYAKEYCSCRFVIKQSKEYCDSNITTYLDAELVEFNDESKTVSYRSQDYTVKSSWISDRLGCRMD